ncbi:MAG TPA: HNH endonuclease signature motif containing protein [Mycobacterium sp.]|jgi:hypothetical protein|nr:HNH endonuclease signature motif containing protein [Mycobacterium sp.]
MSAGGAAMSVLCVNGHERAGNEYVYGSQRRCKDCARESRAKYMHRISQERVGAMRRTTFEGYRRKVLSGVIPDRCTTPLGRFMARIDRSRDCWLWTGRVNQNGYGVFDAKRIGIQQVYAHRFSYELHVGPIPAGLSVDHLCRTPLCVRPSHLEVVTLGENARRGNLAKTHCPQGHPLAPPHVYIRPNGKRMCRTCSNERSAARRAALRKAA